VRAYERHALAFGQVADNARDEALYLLLRTLDLPLDSRPEVLRRSLQPEQVGRIKEVLRRRILDRTPAAIPDARSLAGRACGFTWMSG
jgi:ribosomal protein L3 glutamine methyltransferase